MSAQRMLKSENFCVVTPNEIMNLGSNRQWMLKPLNETLIGNLIIEGLS